jgi:AraC family transcriptional regulator
MQHPFSFTGSVHQQLNPDGFPVTLHQYECAPGQFQIEAGQRHTLLINVGPGVSIRYRKDIQWRDIIVSENAIICVLPAGIGAHIQCTQKLQIRSFAFDPEFARRVFTRHAFLHEQWNLADPIISDFSNRMFAAMSIPNFPERTYGESLAILCIAQFLQREKNTDALHERGKLSPRQLQTVIAFAHDSMQSDIGLMDLASLVHLSAYHFGRLFKQTIGLSPYQYILQMRIEYAKKLILENAGPLGEIAYQLNFSDQAHFSNAFRKATGISPRQYQHGQSAVI